MLPAEQRSELFEVQIEAAEQSLRPAGKEQVGRMLAVIAATQQCKLPSQEALLKYYDILSQYPVDLLDIASNEFLRKCTYQKFPLISELTTEVHELLELRRSRLKAVKDLQDDFAAPAKLTDASGNTQRRRSQCGLNKLSESLPPLDKLQPDQSAD
jgi:hypothetical protein